MYKNTEKRRKIDKRRNRVGQRKRMEYKNTTNERKASMGVDIPMNIEYNREGNSYCGPI
jgi:hypothetical protein